MKTAALFLFLLIPFFSHAFSAGEKVTEPQHKLQWLDCAPMPFGEINPQTRPDIPELRAVVFFYTRAQDSTRTITMLENLRRQYQGKVLIAAITPDPAADAGIFRKKFPDIRVRMAVDSERRVTPEFMRNSIMLFPMAFLIDRSGLLLWRGEAVDLPEMVDRHFKNTLDPATQKKTDPMVYKTQQYMRDGNLFKVFDNAVKLLNTDPANPSALRLAVFAAENTGKIAEAWRLTDRSIAKLPDSPRLFFTALDLTMRHASLRRHLPELIRKFSSRPFAPEIRCAFIDALLNSFPFDADAVLGARDILAATPMPLDSQAAQIALILAVRGRLHYALGDLESAANDLQEAVELLKRSKDQNALQAAGKQLKFFRTLLKNRQGSGK